MFWLGQLNGRYDSSEIFGTNDLRLTFCWKKPGGSFDGTFVRRSRKIEINGNGTLHFYPNIFWKQGKAKEHVSFGYFLSKGKLSIGFLIENNEPVIWDEVVCENWNNLPLSGGFGFLDLSKLWCQELSRWHHLILEEIFTITTQLISNDEMNWSCWYFRWGVKSMIVCSYY